MIVHYFDSSAWVKRYFREDGSEAVASLFANAESIACSRLGMVEIAATIARKGRHEHLSPEMLASLLTQARADFLLFEAISASDAIMRTAETLAFDLALRMGDALHLASALTLAEREGASNVVMVSADVELLAAADARGLAGLNPGGRP